VLREWGWEAGLERLRQSAESSADPGRRAGLRVLIGWLAGDRGRHAEALGEFRAAADWPGLAGWVRAGEAFVALRERRYPDALGLLERAWAAAGPNDKALRGAVAHARGALAFRAGRSAEALTHLADALGLLGPDHFGTGRVLDTLGMVHAARDHFAAAVEFYAAALASKRRHGDEAGVALTHGQLGRLYLDWGKPDRADEELRKAVAAARTIGDERGEAQALNQRGRVALARGRPAAAAALLDESVRSAADRWPDLAGYAHKDRALAFLAAGDAAAAERACDRATALFEGIRFAEGGAHAEAVRGLIRQAQGRPGEAVRHLRRAADYFRRHGERAEAARRLRELAGALGAAGAADTEVAHALRSALELAEAGRRVGLAAEVGEELRAVSEADYWQHLYRRSRGPAGWERDCGPAAALVVSLEGEAADDPGRWRDVCNQLYADLADAADPGEALVQYRGDGLLVAARGGGHATRAAAVGVAAVRLVEEFNRPRSVMKWPLCRARAGVATGTACVGPVGGGGRDDLSAFGRPVHHAAALAAAAQPGRVLVSEGARRLLEGQYTFRPAGDVGGEPAWEVG
jgi:tetratricopeptide (TPR) repeat protein